MRYILALDEGTTSSRAVVYDTRAGKVIAQANRDFELIYKHSGWVEADAVQIWSAQFTSLSEAIAESNIDLDEVYGIGITNQRETVIAWDKKTGLPLYNAIIWQCRRTADFCNELSRNEKTVEMIKRKTGLTVDPYFSASKIKWLFDNVPLVKEKAEKHELCIGTVDSYIIFRLTGGKSFVTDASNAARTMLMDISTGKWDNELLELFGVPVEVLPEIVDSNARVGETTVLNKPVTVCGIAGDQQAALFGQSCFDEGEAKSTYGTGCFILMNTGDNAVKSDKLVTTVAWSLDGKLSYAMEGSVFNGGSAVQWLRDNLHFMKKSSESEKMAFDARNSDGSEGTDGVYVVPAFTGMGAPYWDSDARGIITGITRNTDINHIVRATLESMAYSVRDVIECMEQDSQVKISTLKADGGAAENGFLMQFQSDMLGCDIELPENSESTVMGAVYLCGLGTGVFNSPDEIRKQRAVRKVFSPKMDEDCADRLYDGWRAAVDRALK